MRHNLNLQILALLVFILNIGCYLIVLDKAIVKPAVLVIVMIILIGYDYQVNFKKNKHFTYSTSHLILVAAVMWLFKGFYSFAIVNLFLFVLALWCGRKLDLKEDE